MNHLATLKYLFIKSLGRITCRCLGSGYKHVIYDQKVISCFHCPSNAISNLPWSLLHHRLLSCLSSCNHLEMSRINPDLHLSKLYSTQLHWHLFHLVAQVNISVPFFCGHSTNFPLMKQLALLVPHIYSQLFHLPNIPRAHLITLPTTLLEKGLFTS